MGRSQKSMSLKVDWITQEKKSLQLKHWQPSPYQNLGRKLQGRAAPAFVQVTQLSVYFRGSRLLMAKRVTFVKEEGSWWEVRLHLPSSLGSGDQTHGLTAWQVLYHWAIRTSEFVLIASVCVICRPHICMCVLVLYYLVHLLRWTCCLVSSSVDHWGGWIWWWWQFSYQLQGWSKVGQGHPLKIKI